jgi:ParB family chromosome partitioning protein
VRSTAAALALEAIAKSFPMDWRKAASQAARFAAFRSLPQEKKLDLLAYSVALTLQPKIGPAEGDEATAYDAALALTGAGVESYWRPTKDSYLGRITREQLLTLARDTLGEQWAQARASEKKSTLVEQLDRAFTDPAKYGQTPEQVENLKRWLPVGMAFVTIPPVKTAKARQARMAA